MEKLLCVQKERYSFSKLFSSDDYLDIIKNILLYEIREGNINCK